MKSSFFCQNLLSDFLEGLLPSARHEELKKCLQTCEPCSTVLSDLESTLNLLHAMPSRTISHEMSFRITEAAETRRASVFSRVRVSRVVMAVLVPGLLFAGAVILFPKLFPWVTRFRIGPDESQFVRYFPLLQGANEIIEEQANWLHIREPFMRSLWEEGGLSPEEFEKSFQVKPAKGEEK